jgi:hypothetical protein
MTFEESEPAEPEPRYAARPAGAFFDRRELDAILSVYGKMVALGEWRDYAIGSGRDTAVFWIYRRTSELPLYRIEKCPKGAWRQGMYAVLGMSGQILKRGHDLRQVLRFFDRKLWRVVRASSDQIDAH